MEFDFQKEVYKDHNIHYFTGPVDVVAENLEDLKKKYDASEDQLLLAWIMNHPLKISPVIGTTNKERIKAAIESLNINMEKSDWFSLLVASQGHKVP
mgnify:CR=1 FL=1